MHEIPALDKAPVPLVTLRLLKTVSNRKDDGWKFAGIASDETEDVEGDTILRKMLDVSYASQRGYVNWDHSRAPEDQIGYLTTCEVVDHGDVERLSKNFGVDIPSTASVLWKVTSIRMWNEPRRCSRSSSLPLRGVRDQASHWTGQWRETPITDQ